MKCDVYGTEYAKAFQVTAQDRTMTFDSFECAIHALTPRCTQCGCTMISDGLAADGAIYRCAPAPSTRAAAGTGGRSVPTRDRHLFRRGGMGHTARALDAGRKISAICDSAAPAAR